MRSDRVYKSGFAALGYLMTTLDAVEIYAASPPNFMMYKVLIFTPQGCLLLDTGSDSVYRCSILKTRAIGLLRAWRRLKYPPVRVTMRELIDNWQRHGLSEYRVIERLIVSRWSSL